MFSFYPRDAMLARVIAIATCPSVCPSRLHMEANEMPMELRRRRLASQYSLKICSNLSNPARNCAFDERFMKFFDKRPNQIHPLGLRIKTDLSTIGFKQKHIFTWSISTVPPWLLKPPSIDVSLSSFAKAETIPEVFKSKFLEIWSPTRFLSDLHRWIKNEQRHSSSSREWWCSEENYLRMLMQQQSWILSKKSTFIILFSGYSYFSILR